MTSLFRIFLLLLSSIILCRAVVIPVIYGNYMFDLRPSGFDFTAVLANRWNISRDLTGQTKTSVCSSNLLFGGIGVLRGGDTISRTYDSLPSHGMVTFSISVFFMGDWQTTDTMSLEVDSNPAFQFSPKEVLTQTGETPATDCSGLIFFTFTFLVGRITHSSSKITFKISSTTNTQAFYGIKDVIALFTPYSSSGPTGIHLMTKNENSGVAGALNCPMYKYKDSNNVCQSCHSNCNKCFGPGEDECYACGLDATYDVTLGKCVHCTTGCMHCTGIQSNECLVCLHKIGYVLDYDGTCKTSCTSPYVEDSAGNLEGIFCRQACPDPSHSRLIDNTCVSSCPTPLVQRISRDGKGKFCDSPCGLSSIDYYYWNTSCKSICPFFSRTENGGYNYCDSCPIGQFMHANNSCEATCSSLFDVKTVEGYKFCDFKCGRFSTDYYYTVDASCHSTCPFYSRIVDDFNFCYACPTGQFLHSNYSCKSSCHSSFNVIDIQGYKFCEFPCGRYSTDFYHWDGTCSSTCSYYSRTTDGYKFCDACSPGLFMHPNISCEASCPSPYKNRTLRGSLFCDYPCQANEYFYWNHTCKSNCDSPNLKQTLYFDYCKTPCQQSDQYMFKNNSCSATCPTPLVAVTEVDAKFCDFPCGRFSNDYYYWNTSCKSTCPFYSRNTDGYNFCDVCLGGTFMHSNRSCETGCASPFNTLVIEGYKFCDFSCGRFSTDYYYWNTSCKSTCAFYSRINDGFHFCDACSPGHFMHPNISCETSCNYPYKNRTQGGSMFCDYPCQTNEYFYWNHTCKSNCDSPNLKQTLYFDYCKTPCQQLDQYMFKNNSCSATCPTPLVAVTEVDAKFCDFPCGRFSNDYYYWNTSCKSTCPFYSRNTDGYNFCDVCLGGTFMHSNRSCETGCASPFSALVVEGYKFCDFPCGRFSTDYYYWNTSCRSNCSFSNRNADGFHFCDACPLGSGLFMHPNASCLVNCTYPYKSRTQGGSLLCDYPCQTGEYFDWNYICKPSCGSPLVKRTLYFDYCETPCQQSDNYMLWDNSCSNSCFEPLVIRTENKAKFCDSPCGRTSTDFLYWNASCIATCPYYPRNANGYIFCDACQPGYFMYPNTTCQSQCSFPYILKKQGGSQFCLYPCEKAKGEFYYPVQSQCLSLCKYPYQIQDEIFCVLIIQKEEAAQLQTFASATSGSNTITSSVGKSVGLVNFQNPAVIFSQLFSSMLDYIKYTSIKFPPKLQYIYDADPDPLFRIIPLLPEAINEKFPVKSLPDNFKKYNLHSSFFVNFWDSFFTLVCIIISIVLVVIMGLLTKSCSSVQSLCNYIKNLMKWNFFLAMFTSYFGDIMLFSSLEFRTIDFDSVFPILSLVLCFLTNILIFVVFIKMIKVIIARRALKKQMNSNSRAQRAKKKSLLKRLAGFEVMFEGSRDSTVMQQAFMFLFIGRYFLFAGVIAYLNQYPLVQISIICFMSASMLIYLLFVRPMKTIVDFLQYFLEELTMLVCKICFLILSVYDELQYEENDTREILGEVILKAMLVLSGLSALYIFIQLLGTLRGVYQTIVIWYTKSKEIENAKNESSDIERQTITKNFKNLRIKPKKIRSEWRVREKSLQFLEVKPVEGKNENFLRRRGEREESVQASHHLQGKGLGTITKNLPIKPKNIRSQWRAQEKSLQFLDVKEKEGKNESFLQRRGEREESVQASHHSEGKRIIKRAFKKPIGIEFQRVTNNRNLN